MVDSISKARLSDGQMVVLKVAPPPEIPVLRYEADIMGAEVEALSAGAWVHGGRTRAPTPSAW